MLPAFKDTLKHKALSREEWASLNPAIREKFAEVLKKRGVV